MTITPDPPYLRCVACGWVHCAATEADYAFKVLDRCFKCKGLAFEVIAPDAAPRGVTLLPLRWPPIKRGPTIPKDQLAAAIPADRLLPVVQGWLWEFPDPDNWPTDDAAREMIDALEKRPDAESVEVERAIVACREYLRGKNRGYRPQPLITIWSTSSRSGYEPPCGFVCSLDDGRQVFFGIEGGGAFRLQPETAEVLLAPSPELAAAAHKGGDFHYSALGKSREPLRVPAQLDYIRWLYQGDTGPA